MHCAAKRTEFGAFNFYLYFLEQFVYKCVVGRLGQTLCTLYPNKCPVFEIVTANLENIY